MEPPAATDSTKKPEELKVFISGRESTCGQCGETLEPGAWITLAGEAGARCLPCSDLEELVFLPSGNMALTRRARAHSVLSAVVLKWSRSRKRYERQGLLVQEAALAQAEKECLADADVRMRERERAAERRAATDEQYVREFAGRIRELYPSCPEGRDVTIAEHACRKYSGRVGRCASAKQLDENAITLAVRAHIRHCATGYDRLLGSGASREDARASVMAELERVSERWKAPRGSE